MKNHYRYIGLLISVAVAVLSAERAPGQDCPCDAPPGAMYSDGSNPLRPDLILEGGIPGELEYGIGNHVAACSHPFCGYACRSEGYFFSVESVFIDVWQEDDESLAPQLLESRFPTAPEIDGLDADVDPSARFMFGYQTCDGLGVQVRFWEFDHVASTTVDSVVAEDPDLVLHSWDVMAFDVEVVRNHMITQVWDTSLSGGYRFVRYEEAASVRSIDINEVIVENASIDTTYIGNGLTGAAGVRRQLAGCFSLMANARASLLLIGTQEVMPTGVTLPPRLLRDSFDVRYIFETQFGANYEHPLCGGGFWFIRGGYEVQHWNDFVVPIGDQADPGSTLLHGLFLAFGLQR